MLQAIALLLLAGLTSASKEEVRPLPRLLTVPKIPVAGEPFQLKAEVHNPSDETLPELKVSFSSEGFEIEPCVLKSLPPGGTAWATARCTAAAGWVEVRVTLSSDKASLMGAVPGQSQKTFVNEVPVVAKPLWFAWYGSNVQHLRYANVITTVSEQEEADAFRAQGAIPCSWAAGVCKRERSVDKFAGDWIRRLDGHWGAIAIDEFGYHLDPKVDQRMAEALKKVRKERPQSFLVAWHVAFANDALFSAYRGAADLVIPEIYLNYEGGRMDGFEQRVKGMASAVRKYELENKAVIGLSTTTDHTGVNFEELEEMFRIVKRVFPESRGMGFFNSYRTIKGIPERADELCEKYYVMPVVQVLEAERTQKRTVRLTLANTGGMEARDVRMCVRKDDRLHIEEAVDSLSPGEQEQILIQWKGPWKSIVVELKPSDQYTVLDEALDGLVWERDR